MAPLPDYDNMASRWPRSLATARSYRQPDGRRPDHAATVAEQML